MCGLITGFFCTIKFNQMKTLILLHNSGIVNPTLVKQYQKKRDEMMQKNNFKVVELDKKRNRGSQYEKCNFLVVGK